MRLKYFSFYHSHHLLRLMMILLQLLLFHMRMCFWIKSKFAPFLFLVVLCHMFNTSFGFSVSNIDHFRVKLVEKCICKLPIKLLALSLDKSIGGGYIYSECKKVRLPYIKWDAGQRILNRIAQGIIYERTRKENKIIVSCDHEKNGRNSYMEMIEFFKRLCTHTL